MMLTFLMLPLASIGAETLIHRCPQEDGTVAFQELPCPAHVDDSASTSTGTPDADASSDENVDFVNPFDDVELSAADTEPLRPTPGSALRASCVKTARDAIDTIDDEMRKGYTQEEGQAYLAELLRLTEQLRTCKQL
ncbi:MAG TPA: hypothetical protein PKK10_00405 [Woeseiaceae bacterium]|nr:hypothetical protein [Woeseiaceae bacterium]